MKSSGIAAVGTSFVRRSAALLCCHSRIQSLCLFLLIFPTVITSFVTNAPVMYRCSSTGCSSSRSTMTTATLLSAVGTGLDPPDQAVLGGIISLFIGLSVYTTVHPEVTDMIRKAFDERMEPLPDGSFERGGKIVSSANTKTTATAVDNKKDPHAQDDDEELDQSVERIHELTEQMSKLADELAAASSKTELLDQRIEMAKNAIYTIPREYREPVAPIDNTDETTTKKRFRFWPWRRRSKRRRQ